MNNMQYKSLSSVYPTYLESENNRHSTNPNTINKNGNLINIHCNDGFYQLIISNQPIANTNDVCSDNNIPFVTNNSDQRTLFNQYPLPSDATITTTATSSRLTQ